MSEGNTEAQAICEQLQEVVCENREAFEASQPPKSFSCLVTAWGPRKGYCSFPMQAMLCACYTQAHRGIEGTKKSLQNLPELLELKLLGELSVLEVQCFLVPFPPQSHPGCWVSHHHPGVQLPHLYPGPPAAQSGEIQVPGAWKPHGHTCDTI